MATKKYLDYEGVKYLWSKIGGKIDNATDSLFEKFVVTINTNQSIGGGVLIPHLQ